MSPIELQAAEELCRTPSGYEIEFKDGKYILDPDTYSILAERANLVTPLLEHIKNLNEDLKKERWCHAACLTIAEGRIGWKRELLAESPATKAVRDLRMLANEQKNTIEDLKGELRSKTPH